MKLRTNSGSSTLAFTLSLFVVALVLNLSTSLPNNKVNGIDSQSEMITSQRALLFGWDISLNEQNNTSIVVTAVAPSLSNISSINLTRVYKIVLPIVFSLTAPLLFLVYRRFDSPSIAYTAALFFVVLPPSFKEVPTIAKSMLAEPLTAACLFVAFGPLKDRLKVPLTALLILLTAMSHYTVGAILVALLLFVSVFVSIRDRKVDKLLITTITAASLAIVYFIFVGSGILLSNAQQVFPVSSDTTLKLLGGSWSTSLLTVTYLVIQYCMFGLLGIGFLYQLTHQWKTVTFAGSAASVLLIALNFVPRFSTLLYVNRTIQITAIFTAFSFALASRWIPLKVMLPIMIIYTVFTSGIPYLLTREPGLPIPTAIAF